MKAKYQNNIKIGSGYGPYLNIDSDLELRDLLFVSELKGVTHLSLFNCQNALRAPANLRAFSRYSSTLKTAKGVERLVGLERDLRDNSIVELNIRGLDKLKELCVIQYIRDLSGAEYLKVLQEMI
ncbi:Hypothetical_protein [Hexamita inflata]|uniref:Hypothetical_protein n=1 Tax=Hexamita inflata TaxID=28002 RepID=A0AA86PG66_9EUKA|nr:Hypothetical protein HINF_LOCUS25407 [Hexamita inflata]